MTENANTQTSNILGNRLVEVRRMIESGTLKKPESISSILISRLEEMIINWKNTHTTSELDQLSEFLFDQLKIIEIAEQTIYGEYDLLSDEEKKCTSRARFLLNELQEKVDLENKKKSLLSLLYYILFVKTNSSISVTKEVICYKQ